ncbi:MAG TPA: GNAT family N-acetyltransferase [Solirubrobacterales bacterium]|nr:GNAT family N-acetyltransferase [Solirubrobacterales bacterium]
MSPAAEDGEAWLRLNVDGMLWTWRTLARANGAGVFERAGVFALRNPRVRERSVFNSVAYTDPAELIRVREDLAAFYGELGSAWTVWAPEGDMEVGRALEDAGHVLDAAPRAMGRSLDGVEEPDLTGIDWTPEGAMEPACLINDHAYGIPEGTWIKGNGREPENYRTYLAELDGEPAATVATVRAGDDCVIWSVATERAARGRGLATALMRRALWDARQEGCSTTTLQATRAGRPVYERIGYRDFGALHMWELRPAELAGSAHRRPPA